MEGLLATDLVCSGLDVRMSPGKEETAALPRAGNSAGFSISGRHSAIEKICKKSSVFKRMVTSVSLSLSLPSMWDS